MITQSQLQLVRTYAPYLYFDRKEPFFPVRVGTTVIRNGGTSPSFNRTFAFRDDRIDYVLEYAIYWDFDIQHLYELEHVWIYVAKDGSVADCEASFHGKYFKGLLRDRSNLHGTHVSLYSQPGKHAFSPLPELFELLPNLYTCTDEEAGDAGLIVTAPFQGIVETNAKINERVRRYLQKYRFKPAMQFVKYELVDDLFTTWNSLREEVPVRIHRILQHIENEERKERN